MTKKPVRVPRARIIFFVFFVALAAFSIPQVWASKAEVVTVDGHSAALSVTLGKAELVQLPGQVSDVLVANSSIVDVQAVQSNRLYIVGLELGDTNIIALDANGDVLKEIDVHVHYDLVALRALVDEMFPDEGIEIRNLAGRMILTGTASNPQVAAQVQNIIANYLAEILAKQIEPDEYISNNIRVRGEQQVMLQVRVVEASRNFIRDFGLNTVANDVNELSPSTVFGGFPPNSSRGGGESLTLSTAGGTALPNDPAATFRLLADSSFLGIGTVGMFLDLLEQENLVSVLAEPNLTAISGQQAGFLAGGEFPVPVGRDQVGNLVIEYREFGVSLNFRPVVMSDDRINLQLNTEVSSLDFVNSVGAGDLLVPGLDIRRADTTIEIPSGGTLMIAGLLQSDAVEGLSGLPGVRNTPILGDLISSNSFARNETELVVMVTAYKVEPFADKTRSEKLPKQRNNPLAESFAANLRNRFTKVDDDIFNSDQRFGYILD